VKSAGDITVYCMVATPFDERANLDLDAYRDLLDLMCQANVGVYLGSGGAGEGHALTVAELAELYQVGVETCRGRVPVAANPREARTATDMLALATEAARAGVDLVQLYPLDAGHGMIPTAPEQERYYRFLLERLDHPAAISVHVSVGYVTPIPLLVKLAKEYRSIEAINVMGPPLDYFVALSGALQDAGVSPKLYAGMHQLLPTLYAGGSGCLAAEPNLVPRLSRAFADAIAGNDQDRVGDLLVWMTRLQSLVSRWAPSTARWVKMGLNVLGLPGGNGVIREPYVLPGADALAEMSAGFEALGLSEREGSVSR
jgi:4-hydroxy-tetrahydrodipicolinate synthase